MEKKIDKAIELLSGMISDKTTADEALKYTQAIVNLSNAKRALGYIKKD